MSDTAGNVTVNSTTAVQEGNDEFVLDIATNITASQIEFFGQGNAPSGTPSSANRDRLTINDNYLLVTSAEGEDPCPLLSDPSDSTTLRIDWLSLPVSFEVNEVAPDCFHFDSPNHQISKAIWRRLPGVIDE